MSIDPGTIPSRQPVPLAYLTPSINPKPSILGIIGVLSIVVGSFGILSGLGAIVSGVGFLVMPRIVATAGPTSAPAFPIQFSGRIGLISLISAAPALCLAVLLLVAGISVVRDSPKAARRHWIYVWVKIPVILLSTVMSAMMYNFIFSGMPAPPGPAGKGVQTLMVVFSMAGSVIFSLAYPVTLIIVFSMRRVKDYYVTLNSEQPIR